MKKLILLFLIHLLSSYVYTQNNHAISGKVVDAVNDNVLPYATVVLYKSDSVMVKALAADDRGTFLFQNISGGNYFIRLSYIAYETRYLQINLPDDSITKKNIGTIKLSASVNKLSDVKVVAQKNTWSHEGDKMTVNVSMDPASGILNMADLLSKTPSVSVDDEQNISIRGRSDFLVFYDGKPFNPAQLPSLSLSGIEKIEVITNPSAKYDASGMGGVLNLYSKKNTGNSYSALVNISAGFVNRRKGDVAFFYAKNFWKFGFSASYNYMESNCFSDRKRLFSYNDTNFYTKDFFKRIDVKYDHFIKLDACYDNKKWSFGGDLKYGFFGLGKIKKGPDESGIENSETPVMTESNYVNFNSNIVWPYLEASFIPRYITPSGKNKWDALLFASVSNGFNNYILNYYHSSDLSDTPEYFFTDLIGERTDVSAEINYEYIISKKVSLETGTKSKLFKSMEDYRIQLDQLLPNSRFGVFENGIGFLHATTTNQAAFANIKAEFSQFKSNIGLRYENYQRVNDSHESYHKLATSELFPVVSVLYSFSDSFSTALSTGKRIHHPYPWLVSPFILINDGLNVTKGNMYLKPEWGWNTEWLLNKSFKNFQLVNTVYYRHSYNSNTQTQNQLFHSFFMYSFENVRLREFLGSELVTNILLFNKVKFQLSLNYFYNRLAGDISSVKNFDKANTSYEIKNNISFQVVKSIQIQISSHYIGKELDPQGITMPIYFSNLNIKFPIYKNKISGSLYASDIFYTSKMTHYNIFENENAGYYSKWHKPYMMFSLSFNLNQYKEVFKSKIESQKGGL